MALEYTDLDGIRLGEIDGPNVWLIFDGKRHRVSSPSVYNSLFSETDRILFNDALPDIETGVELGEGTCLIQFEGDSAIYLAVASGDSAHILHITSYETFVDFGFNLDKVKEIPAVLFHVTQKAGMLTSAPDRAGRTL